ncbi:MAG TPA: T9SS type A sorting domain-containing protein [Bacteroidia bacterium]
MRYLYICILIAIIPSVVLGQIITTIAGNGAQGFSGDGGQATNAELNYPTGVYFDTAGNMYITDDLGNRIRKVNTLGIITTVAGNGYGAGTPSCTPCYSGDGGQATAAKLNSPCQIAIDGAGNLYIADAYNHCIRIINTTGIISTFAGTGIAGYSGDGGQATAAQLYEPNGLAYDVFGNLYIADDGNDRIRVVNTAGTISTFAGNGAACCTLGDGGLATNAEFKGFEGIAIDAIGNIYIADWNNYRIRMVNTAGIISTVAGNGNLGFSGDGGQATAAEIDTPDGVTCDMAGNLYISEGAGIRKVNTNGIISTIVGNEIQGFSGDGGQATAAELNIAAQVAFDASGNMYIADGNNNRIRKVTNVGQAGIKQVANSLVQVTVYPNPASTNLILTLSKGAGKATVCIYDMLGKLVMQQVYSPPSEGQGEAIDVSDLAEGLYLIRLSNAVGVQQQKLLISR